MGNSHRARLRDLELPLDEIRAVLATDDPAEQRRRIAVHRARLEARTFRLQRVLHRLGQISDGKESIVPDAPAATSDASLDAATHRRLGVDLFNATWSLLELADRSASQTDALIHTAHASRHHWALAEGAGPENLARGEWLCSRVYAVLGRAEPALWHARRCVEICESNGIADWDIAAACEAMARAQLMAGDHGAARKWADQARAALSAIAEADDREIIEQDLDALDLG